MYVVQKRAPAVLIIFWRVRCGLAMPQRGQRSNARVAEVDGIGVLGGPAVSVGLCMCASGVGIAMPSDTTLPALHPRHPILYATLKLPAQTVLQVEASRESNREVLSP